MSEDMGSKYDEDLYQKVDLSLIPWSVLSRDYGDHDSPFSSLARDMHTILDCYMRNPSGGVELDILGSSTRKVFDDAYNLIGPRELAVSLGYGVVKYGRNNWRKGFGGDPSRFLKAAIRHMDAYLRGEAYDGQPIEGYPKGNSSLGAVVFSLMVAVNEANILTQQRGAIEG